MLSTRRFHSPIFGASLRPQSATLSLLLLFFLFGLLFVLLTAQSVQAQTFNVIHTFTGPDGYEPTAGVTLDAAGNLYGTTYNGLLPYGQGNVFQLKRRNGNWVLNDIF